MVAMVAATVIVALMGWGEAHGVATIGSKFGGRCHRVRFSHASAAAVGLGFDPRTDRPGYGYRRARRNRSDLFPFLRLSCKSGKEAHEDVGFDAVLEWMVDGADDRTVT